MPNAAARAAHWRRAGTLAVALVLLAATGAMAQTAVERFAVRAAAEAMTVARAGGSQERLAAKFRSLMRRYGDTGRAAAFALGPYRRDLPPARRREFHRLVEKFAGTLFASYVGEFAGERLEVIGSSRRGRGDVVVRCRIHFTSGRAPSRVALRIVRTGRGLKVFDLQVLGIWLDLRMRSTFVSVLRQNGGDMDALFAYLRS